MYQVRTPDFSKVGIENTKKTRDIYLLAIFDELKSNEYLDGDIEFNDYLEN